LSPASANTVVLAVRAHVHGGGLDAQVVAIVPAHLLRCALGYERVLSDADVDVLAPPRGPVSAWPPDRPQPASAAGQQRVG
jgi:hypothetical protein